MAEKPAAMLDVARAVALIVPLKPPALVMLQRNVVI